MKLFLLMCSLFLVEVALGALEIDAPHAVLYDQEVLYTISLTEENNNLLPGKVVTCFAGLGQQLSYHATLITNPRGEAQGTFSLQHDILYCAYGAEVVSHQFRIFEELPELLFPQQVVVNKPVEISLKSKYPCMVWMTQPDGSKQKITFFSLYGDYSMINYTFTENGTYRWMLGCENITQDYEIEVLEKIQDPVPLGFSLLWDARYSIKANLYLLVAKLIVLLLIVQVALHVAKKKSAEETYPDETK